MEIIDYMPYIAGLNVILTVACFVLLMVMGKERGNGTSDTAAKPAPMAAAAVSVPVQGDDEGEIVAAITAAIYAYGIADNAVYEVKSITEKTSRTQKTSAQRRNPWAEAGRVSNTSNSF
jgi:hypothetical protein